MAVGGLAVDTLVGGGPVQRAEMPQEGTDLNVVEVEPVDRGRQTDTAAVPSHMELRMLFVYILRQEVHPHRVGIASHQRDAGDVLAVLRHKIVDCIGVQRHTDVLPQVAAVAAGTTAGAVGYVDGQGHLIRNLLENDIGINVFQHNVVGSKEKPGEAVAEHPRVYHQ